MRNLHKSCLAAAVILVTFFASEVGICTEIPPGGQIGVTRERNQNNWRIWTRRDDGHLVTVSRNYSPWQWSDLGTYSGIGGDGVSEKGVATTWWVDWDNVRHQLGVFIGEDNVLYEASLVGDEPTVADLEWMSPMPAPSGKVFSGYLTVSTVLDPILTRHLVVFATMTDGTLWTFHHEADTYDDWSEYPWEGLYDPTKPLASTTNDAESILSVFIAEAPPTRNIRLIRYDGGWSNESLGRPHFTANICRSMAATQGRISASPSMYSIELFCTDTITDSYRIYKATAPLETATASDYSWSYISTLEKVRPAQFTLAAAKVAVDYDPNVYELEFYYIGHENKHIYKVTRVPTHYAQYDMGRAPETANVLGGMTAFTHEWLATSRVAYIGRSGSFYLYTRSGETAFNVLPRWEALQCGDPIETVSDSTIPTAESHTSIFRGRAVTAAIERPGGNPEDHANVVASWSNDDGQSWSLPQDLDTLLSKTTPENQVLRI